MTDKSDIEYLKSLPFLGLRPASLLNITKVWYSSDDTIINVARILNDNGVFISTKQVIDFFESPYKWEYDILELIKECEKAEVI